MSENDALVEVDGAATKPFKPWVIAAAYLWVAAELVHAVIGTLLPRTDKIDPMRETLRGWHYSVGTLIGILSVILIVQFWKRRHVPVNAALPAMANRWSYTLVMVSLALFILAPLLGIFNAWGDGLKIHFGPLYFPSLMDENREVWLFAGYFHAAIGLATRLLALAALLSAGYWLLRYGQGLIASFLPGFGAFVFLALANTVYASVTFSSPEPGPRAVAIYVAVVLGFWGLARLLKRQPDKGGPRFSGKAGFGAAAALFVAVPVGLGMYGPYAVFRVKPIEMGAIVEAPANVTSHTQLVTTVQVVPETALEREVREENFKWCGFCHKFKEGERHLAGPNLYGMFGQKIGTVPNFGYTENFAAHGKAGEVWNDDLMHELLEDPDAFAPGTTMVVSSGNMPDFERRAALINILKKETMGDNIELVDELTTP